MTKLFFVGCAILMTVLTDLLGFVRRGVPDGYEDDRGFHFGTEPTPHRK